MSHPRTAESAVLFVCLGNICRSPTAEGVFRKHVHEAGLDHRIHIDSCGTAGYHEGAPPDRRAQAYAQTQGVDLSRLQARALRDSDFDQFDYILVMDRDNLADVKAQAPSHCRADIALLLDFAPEAHEREVPDPYYGGDAGFKYVFALVDQASRHLLTHIEARLGGRT